MIKFFRKIRQKLLSENKFSKYLIYAIGEILLVVIGILIALQVNNWNQLQNLKKTEISILEGIRKDILSDTVDINFNIRAYKSVIRNDSVIINRLINKTGFGKGLTNQLNYTINADWSIVLHESRFEEAKLKGLSIISNNNLRDQINLLYEFDYKYLMMLENQTEYFDETKTLKNIGKYLSVDSTGVTMSFKDFEKLTQDNYSIYTLNNAIANRKMILEAHLNTLESALLTVENIEKEIDILKEK